MEWTAPLDFKIVVTGSLIFLDLLWATTRPKACLSDELPWIGRQSTMFSKARASLGTVRKAREMLEEGYYKYSKAGKVYVLPSWTSGPEAILPPSLVRWMSTQPDDILNVQKLHEEILETDYVFQYTHTVDNPLHEDVIRRDLNRHLGSLTPAIMMELEDTFKQYWGLDTEQWKEIRVFENTMRSITRVTNHVLVGRPLCQNETYLYNVTKFVQAVVVSGSIIRMLPAFLKPIMGRLISLSTRYYNWKCSRFLFPLIEQRMAEMKRSSGSDNNKAAPNDFITWLILDSYSRPKPIDRSVEMIAYRVMLVNFSAIHTTSFTVTNLLFDLFSSPLVSEYVTAMRKEAKQAVQDNHGNWTKAAIAQSVRLDSAVRETMRLSSFMGRGLERKVEAIKGIMLDEGFHLPRGVNVGVSVYSIHHDECFYPRAHEYDAFRFSKPLEKVENWKQIDVDEGALGEETSKASNGSSRNLSSLVSISDTFLSFGHGRHSCPGRFFAATEMKLLLAQILLNYDVEPLAIRPANRWIADTILPPMEATIKIKRRKTD